MGEGVSRTTLDVNNSQDFFAISDCHAHFGTRLPTFDSTITTIFQYIINDNTLTGFENVARDTTTYRILEGLHGTFDNILTCTAKACDGQVPFFICDEHGT